MENKNSSSLRKSKLIQIFGPPASGKSTLAAEVHTELKKKGINSILVSEVSTDYIAEYGIPNTPSDQMIIFYKQLNREKMFLDSKDYIICDSSSILNYFYFRSLFGNKLSNKDIASINHIQKEILKHINIIDMVFYVPPIDTNINDGIRFHNGEQISKLGTMIKSYLELENIRHDDLSNIDMSTRVDYIIKSITK
jgi:nicotinamide riboside kinase